MPPRGRRTETGTRTRSAILDSTIALLGRHGPEGLSASAIANEAGVSKATLFHHFRTVDEIPLVALERFWATSLARRSTAGSSLRGYLAELGDQVGSLAGKRRQFLRAHLAFLVKAMFDPRLGRLLASASVHMHELTVGEVARRLPRRRRAEDVEVATRMVEMILDGMMIGLAVQRGPKARTLSAHAWRRFLDLLLPELEEDPGEGPA